MRTDLVHYYQIHEEEIIVVILHYFLLASLLSRKNQIPINCIELFEIIPKDFPVRLESMKQLFFDLEII